MRRPAYAFALVLVGCATAPRHVPKDVVLTGAAQHEPLPAGLCGFDDYLRDECSDQIARAVVIVRGQLADAHDAEAALAKARALPGLALGYPFAVHHHDLAARDRHDGIAVVVAAFASRAGAVVWQKEHGGDASEVVDLLSPEKAAERRAGDAKRRVVVEVVTPTAAWDAATLEGLANAEPERKQRELARSRLTAACTVERGRLFVAARDDLYKWSREYAPVECNGRAAWIPWRATRLESVVTRSSGQAVIHQVIDVTCDSPTVEDRPFGVRSGALLAFGHCPG